MKATNKDGTRSQAAIKKVLNLRDNKATSWQGIRKALADSKPSVIVSGSTVRRMYDEGHGRKGAHHDSRPLPGGRYVGGVKPGEMLVNLDKAAKKATAPKAAVRKQVNKPAPSKAREGSGVSSVRRTVTPKATTSRKPAAKATAGTARKATKKTATPASDSSERPAEQVG